MAWPFEKEKPADSANANPDDPKAGDPPKPEKTPAELIAEALSPMKEALDGMSQRFENLERNTIRKPEPSAEPAAGPVSVFDDENQAFAQRVGPLLMAQFDTNARLARAEVKTEYARAGFGDLWDQYESQINAMLNESPLATAEGKPLRGDPQYIRNVVDMIFGREARKAGMRFDAKAKSFFLEGGSGGEGSHSTAPANDGLTEGQRKVFQRMKVTPEDAKKTMAKLKFVS